MTIEQNKIADQLLKFISSNNGMVNTDQYSIELTKNGASLNDIILIREKLLALNIIQYVNGSDKYRIMLTPLAGNKAVQFGLEKYINSLQNEIYLKSKQKVKDFTKELLTYLNENGGLNSPIRINEFLKNLDLEDSKTKLRLMGLVSEGLIYCPSGRGLGNTQGGRKYTLDNLNIEATLRPKGLEFYTAHYKENSYSEQKTDITTINERLNEVIEWLKRNELGNEIIFVEIQELKEAGKKLDLKNWQQLVKGKLYDLATTKVVGISIEGLREILNTLTGEDLTKMLR